MGAVDLRRLRRVRAGLPDRRADAGRLSGRQRGAGGLARPQGGQPLPLLRRGLPGHLRGEGREARLRHRPRRSGEPQPALRQGPLRLRLHPSPAPPDDAADPAAQRRRRTRTTRSTRPTRGRISARRAGRRRWTARPRRLRAHPRRRTGRRRWPGSARPRDRTRRLTCSRSWCAPASASTTSTTARGSATPRSVAALMEGLNSGAVTRAVLGGARCRGHHRHRRQPDRESSGRGHLHQERGQGARRQADRHRPAAAGAVAPRAAHISRSSRAATWRC